MKTFLSRFSFFRNLMGIEMPDEMDKIRQLKRSNEREWMALDGVVAVGIGLTEAKEAGIIISVKKDRQAIRSKIPAELNGIRIDVIESGEIVAQ